MTGFVVLMAVIVVVATTAIAVAVWAEPSVEEHTRRALDVEAGDWGEPSREAVERLMDGDDWARANGYDDDWRLFPAPEFAETPIYAQLRHEGDVLFAAEVLATIDELPGGAV